jgi:hypothetical protein
MTRPWWSQRLARRARAVRGDRGSSDTLQLAILAPVLLLLLFIGVQAMVYFHADNVAQAAARHGVEVGRSYDAQPGDGTQAAREFLLGVGGDDVLDPSVSAAGSTGQRVQITVTGRVPSLIPGLDWEIQAVAQGPVERVE